MDLLRSMIGNRGATYFLRRRRRSALRVTLPSSSPVSALKASRSAIRAQSLNVDDAVVGQEASQELIVAQLDYFEKFANCQHVLDFE